ncbi:hypothetical protein OC846_000093 [Tilletia horrida]|uniref:Thioredoxin domain-containing protein n=1 Tax=Tilletia horrida TaxID=155126 RepID=A0AAN6GVM2_9BASI|nr:hypothetical protein OC846_000093 [Tilletia horrida]
MRVLSLSAVCSLLLSAFAVEQIGAAPTFISDGDLLPTALLPRGPVGGKVPGLHLNSATFRPTVEHGAWLVEFYSPSCHHCQKFAPTWEDVVKMSGHFADSSDFRMARVDCMAQGDLCNEQKVKWYPSVKLYFDGQQKGDYSGDRTYDDLMNFVKAKAADYRQVREDRLKQQQP